MEIKVCRFTAAVKCLPGLSSWEILCNIQNRRVQGKLLYLLLRIQNISDVYDEYPHKTWT